jgi:hypothetical protein
MSNANSASVTSPAFSHAASDSNASHSSDYTAAPATALVATGCACCGKDLVDAESVEAGMGPWCRKNHGYGKASLPADWDAAKKALGEVEFAQVFARADLGMGLDDTARRAANILVHRIACLAPGNINRRVIALSALGFETLAGRIAMRLGGVRVEEDGNYLVVYAPKRSPFNATAHVIRGIRRDRKRGAHLVPIAARTELWALFRRAFRGYLIVGRRIAVA